MEEQILKYFKYEHLPEKLRNVSKPFCELAHAIALGDNAAEAGTCTTGHGPLPRCAERTVALRKLPRGEGRRGPRGAGAPLMAERCICGHTEMQHVLDTRSPFDDNCAECGCVSFAPLAWVTPPEDWKLSSSWSIEDGKVERLDGRISNGQGVQP